MTFRKRYLALIVPLLTALALSVVVASAHVIVTGSVKVNCEARTVSVTVQNWSGAVEIDRLHGTGTATFAASRAPKQANTTVYFTLAEIGGDGNYQVGRSGFPLDPRPVKFTVACTPTPSPSPSPTPTAGFSSTSRTLGAATATPHLPASGHPAR